MRILLAVILFSAIVLFHELGHFLLAKANGVVVEEFSLGMGPRLVSFVRGGTRYSIKIFPFGGSCMMKGEDMEDASEGSFGGKSVWARLSIVAAGPVFNFLLAFVLAVILLANVGVDRPVLLGVSEGFPAQEAGMQAGDVITSIDGKSIRLYREISNYGYYHQDRMASGDPIPVTYLRDKETYSALLTPQDDGSGRYIFGFQGTSSYREKVGALETVKYGACEVKFWIGTVLSSLRLMFTGHVNLNDISGPVGVVNIIGDTYEQSRPDGAYYVWLNMMNIAILLSANLGVMNLLPIPALDGGRLLFLLVEAVRRKRINQEIEGRIHLAGLMLLLALMAVVMVNDIRNILP